MKIPTRIAAVLAVAALFSVGAGAAHAAPEPAPVTVDIVSGRVVSCTPHPFVSGAVVMTIEVTAGVTVTGPTARDISARATSTFGNSSSSYSIGDIQTVPGDSEDTLTFTGEGMAGSPTLEIMFNDNVVGSSSAPVVFECPSDVTIPAPEPTVTPAAVTPAVTPAVVSAVIPAVNVVPPAKTDGFDHAALVSAVGVSF